MRMVKSPFSLGDPNGYANDEGGILFAAFGSSRRAQITVPSTGELLRGSQLLFGMVSAALSTLTRPAIELRGTRAIRTPVTSPPFTLMGADSDSIPSSPLMDGPSAARR